jgi:hypothetical protein
MDGEQVGFGRAQMSPDGVIGFRTTHATATEDRQERPRERRRLGNRDSPSCPEGQSKLALSLDVRRWAEFEAVDGGFCQGHRKGFADRIVPCGSSVSFVGDGREGRA